MSSGLFSLIVPVRNEEEALPHARATLVPILDSLGMPYEVLVVDNGSTDRTPELLAQFCGADRRWKYLRLSRDFGYQSSITAGMLAASGDAIMIIDADLQDPPEMIPQFVAHWRQGYDVVYGVRARRTGESPWRIGLTMLAMRLITWLSDEVKLPEHSGDFRLISRRARDAFARLEEGNRYVRGMIHWLGFRQLGIPYTRRGRTRGISKANWSYLVDFTVNAAVNFSFKPFRLFSFLGLGVLLLTGALGAAWLVAPSLGLTAMHLLQLLTLGTLSTGIGVLGEYVGRTYRESQRRPLWLVDYALNFEVAEQPASLDGPRRSAA
jgi:dolichol-phosphate mannosyltransferase